MKRVKRSAVVVGGASIPLLVAVLAQTAPPSGVDRTATSRFVAEIPMSVPAREQLARALAERVAAIEALKVALGRAKSSDEAAGIKHELARHYELVPESGELARRTYAEILSQHPGYNHCPAVAYRLAELYSCVALPGTKPDRTKAVHYGEHVLRHCPAGRYVRLKAHMLLSQLLRGQGKRGEAQKHLEAIYSFEAASLTPDGYWGSHPRERKGQRMDWLRARVRGIKASARPMLIGTCQRGNPIDTIQALEDLLARFPDDRELAQLAEDARAKALQSRRPLLPELSDIIGPPEGRPATQPGSK